MGRLARQKPQEQPYSVQPHGTEHGRVSFKKPRDQPLGQFFLKPQGRRSGIVFFGRFQKWELSINLSFTGGPESDTPT